MSVFKSLGIGFSRRLFQRRRGTNMLPIAGRGGIETTVDQTLMRGLNTAGPWFVSGLPLSHMARVAVSGSQNHNEGCPDRPPRPTISSVMELNLSPLYLAPLRQAAFVGGMG
ncbi:hypothetical protein, partial [Rhizobium miluonense]